MIWNVGSSNMNKYDTHITMLVQDTVNVTTKKWKSVEQTQFYLFQIHTHKIHIYIYIDCIFTFISKETNQM